MEDKTIVKREIIVKINKPKLYNVILFNDDVTPFDFVEFVLTDVFSKTKTQANEIAMDIHMNDKAIIGTYSKDIAKSKCEIVKRVTEASKLELKITYEEA